MLKEKTIPIQVALLTLLRLWVCGAAVMFFPDLVLGLLEPALWENPVGLIGAVLANVFFAWIAYLILKDIWNAGLVGAVFVAIAAFGLFVTWGLMDIVVSFEPPDPVFDLFFYLIIFVPATGPLILSTLLRRLDECHGKVAATRDDYARAIIRISYAAVMLGAGFVLLLTTSGVLAGTSAFDFMGLLWFVSVVILPAVAYRTWRYHFPSVVLLAFASLVPIWREVRFLWTIEASWERVVEELSFQALLSMPYFLPLIVLWWVGRKPGRGAEAVGKVEEAGEEQPC